MTAATGASCLRSASSTSGVQVNMPNTDTCQCQRAQRACACMAMHLSRAGRRRFQLEARLNPRKSYKTLSCLNPERVRSNSRAVDPIIECW
jgi:hypothetical protein